ncbi:MAG: PAS domain S-box protein [Spirochaetaceae bacterium]|nr:MAG: PAS domain S-box protein [Spirochaetaceae bacterium]
MNENIKKTILLVEDEALIAMSETKVLEKHGYEVILAHNGEQAIEAVNSNPEISLILMDIDLGTGIDGTQAAERILALHDLPIAFLSSHTEPEVVEKTEGITSYGYILKNSGETVLLASIKMAFRLYEAHMELKRQKENLNTALGKYEQTAEELTKKNEELDRYFSSSLDLLCITNTGGEFIRLNPEWEKVVGYSVAELEGQPFLDFVHTEDKDVSSEAVTKLDATEDVTSFENRFRCRDGSYCWIEWRLRRIGTEVYAAARDISERKAAEDALIEREALYRNLMDNSIDGVELLDEDGRFLNVNQKECDMLGYSREELLAMKISDIDPNYPADGFYHFWKEQPKGTSVLFESLHRHKDGTLIPVEVNGIFFKTGDTKYIYGVARDITERKNLERELQDQKNLLQDITDNLFELVALTDNTGTYTFVGNSHNVLGYNADQLLGKKALDFVHPEDRTRIETLFQETLPSNETQARVELRYRRADGSYSWVETSGKKILAEDGEIGKLLFSSRDISERKQAEAQLQQVLNEYDTVFHGTRDAMFLIDVIDDATYRYIRNNRAHAETTRVTTECMANKTPQELMGKELGDKIVADYKRCVQAARSISYEEVVQLPNGRKTWYTTLTPVFDQGKIQYLVGSAQDVTERKQAEEEIQRQLIEKETLLKEVHHRIKNNLAQIESLLSLKAASSDNPEVQAALDGAVSRVHSIKAVYDKLLIGKDYQDLSVKDYIESLVDSIVAVFAERKTISIETNLADFTLSSQRLIPVGIIINELLTNTFRYAFTGRDKGHVVIQLDRTDTHLALSIEDDGVGLDHEAAARNSTGFGLTIVQMLVEQLKGTYSVETPNGRRSVVEFEI